MSVPITPRNRQHKPEKEWQLPQHLLIARTRQSARGLLRKVLTILFIHNIARLIADHQERGQLLL